MKKALIRAISMLLCISTLCLVSCTNYGDTQTEQTTEATQTTDAPTTEDDVKADTDMKNIKINGNTLDKYMIVTEEASSEAASIIQEAFKKELGVKFVLHIEAAQMQIYSTMPYIRIITLPVNGIADTVNSTETKFYEDEGNFKIVLGSRSVSESAAADYFIENILKNNTDLTDYSRTVVLDMDKTLTNETVNADNAVSKIVNASNKYSAADVTGSGKCYYVSYSSGDDTNDGLSPERPWKTIDKVSGASIPAGSVVLFKRGDIWRFDSYANSDRAGYLMLQSDVIYSSYGEGEKPAIYGSPRNAAEVGSWTATGVENVWKYSETYGGMSDSNQDDVGNIIFNGGEAYGYKMIVGDSEINFSGKLSELDSNYKFWYNQSDDRVYLYYDGGNPGEVFDSIEIGVRLNLVRASGKQNIVFDNFSLKYGGAHGFTAALSANITVSNCEIAWLGGGVYTYTATGHSGRYGNGVEIGRDSKDIYIDGNYVHQIYDAGLSHQYDSRNVIGSTLTCYFENINYTNNVITHCFYGIEFFVGAARLDTAAFVIEGGNMTTTSKPLTDNYPRYMDNITIKNNYILYSGYGWGYWRAASGQPGAAHVKAWENFDKDIVDKNGDGKTIVITGNKFIASRYDVIYGVFESKNDIPKVTGNTFVQYSTGKAITLEVTNATVDNNYYKIEKVQVADRKYWNADEMKAHKYLGVNTYITP